MSADEPTLSKNWAAVDLEDAIVASFFVKPDETIERALVCGVTPETFTQELHSRTLETIVVMRKERVQVDEFTIYQRWRELDEDRAHQDIKALNRVIDRVEVVSHFPSWIELHLKNYRNRRRLSTLERGSSIATDDPGEAHQFIAAQFAEIETIGVHEEEADSAGELENAIAEAHRQLSGYRAPDVVTMPIPEWDGTFYPIERHELVIIGARPSVGKSSLAVQTAWTNLRKERRVLFFTLETGAEAVFKQMGAQIAQVNTRRLSDEPSDRVARYFDSLEWLKEATQNQLHVARADRLPNMEAMARRISLRHGPIDLIIVDYLQLVEVEKRGRETRNTELGEVTRRLKKWTDRDMFHCPVIALSQIGRDPEKAKRMPFLSDLRESGNIEQDADRVVFIHRPENSRAGDAQSNSPVQDYTLYQAKLRTGPLNTIDCEFIRPTTTLRSPNTPEGPQQTEAKFAEDEAPF